MAIGLTIDLSASNTFICIKVHYGEIDEPYLKDQK